METRHYVCVGVFAFNILMASLSIRLDHWSAPIWIVGMFATAYFAYFTFNS